MTSQPFWREFWARVSAQYGVITRGQMLELGFSERAIEHRIERGRLHVLWPGVYAVGRREVTREGCWMAAVLACGAGAALSHFTAGVLWDIHPHHGREIHVSVPSSKQPRLKDIRAHRRRAFEVTAHRRIPVTTPICTLVDIAPRLSGKQRERAVIEADKHGLVDPETLRTALDEMPRRHGIGLLKADLDALAFALTDSELEQAFLPIVKRAGLPMPLTQQIVNGFRVDFWWPGLGLVVETDGLTYHRTPAQQAQDRLRDQVHTAAGLTCLRFTRSQVRHDPGHVERTLLDVARRLIEGR